MPNKKLNIFKKHLTHGEYNKEDSLNQRPNKSVEMSKYKKKLEIVDNRNIGYRRDHENRVSFKDKSANMNFYQIKKRVIYKPSNNNQKIANQNKKSIDIGNGGEPYQIDYKDLTQYKDNKNVNADQEYMLNLSNQNKSKIQSKDFNEMYNEINHNLNTIFGNDPEKKVYLDPSSTQQNYCTYQEFINNTNNMQNLNNNLRRQLDPILEEKKIVKENFGESKSINSEFQKYNKTIEIKEIKFDKLNKFNARENRKNFNRRINTSRSEM